MSVTTFGNNGRNISKNIVKLNLKQNTNLYCIILGLHMCKGNIFLISLNLWRFEPFSKLKTACEYWTSIKMKISITCVSKEYEIKTKMEQQQWLQLKMLFLLGYNLKIVAYWGENWHFWGEKAGRGIKIWWGGSLLGGFF